MGDELCRVLLVRHGETRAGDLVPGHAGCPGLSPAGHTQAGALGRQLTEDPKLSPVAAVYSSVMRRAVETAQAIAAALGVSKVIKDCDFCELHEGEADGMTVNDAVEKWWEPASRTSRHLPWNPNAPGAESLLQMVARASGALHRLVLDHPGETVIVTTHGGVIRSSFLCFGDASFRSIWLLSPDNGSITEWLVPVPGFRERQIGPDATARPARLIPTTTPGTARHQPTRPPVYKVTAVIYRSEGAP